MYCGLRHLMPNGLHMDLLSVLSTGDGHYHTVVSIRHVLFDFCTSLMQCLTCIPPPAHTSQSLLPVAHKHTHAHIIQCPSCPSLVATVRKITMLLIKSPWPRHAHTSYFWTDEPCYIIAQCWGHRIQGCFVTHLLVHHILQNLKLVFGSQELWT